jgi:hypothetical protein
MDNDDLRLTIEKASGKRSCLVCNESLRDTNEDVIRARFKLLVLKVKVDKDEEIHLRCGWEFSLRVQELLRDSGYQE